MDQMVTVAKAASRGTKRAMVSCDFPYGPLQEGTDAALKAGIRLVEEADVDMIKLDGLQVETMTPCSTYWDSKSKAGASCSFSMVSLSRKSRAAVRWFNPRTRRLN